MPKWFVEKLDPNGEYSTGPWTMVAVPGDSSIHKRFEHDGEDVEAVVKALGGGDGYAYRVTPLSEATIVELYRPPSPATEIRVISEPRPKA